MKSSIAFTFALFLLCAAPARASQFQIQAGYVSSNFSVTPAATLEAKKGFTFGASLDLDWMGPISFEPGLNYVPKGFSTGTYNQTNSYISLPLLLKLKVPGPIAPFIAAGPELSYEIGTSYSVLAAATLTKSIDLGLQIAGGFEFGLIPAMTNYLRVAYSLGLTNISDSAGIEAKTKALMITLGLVLPF